MTAVLQPWSFYAFWLAPVVVAVLGVWVWKAEKKGHAK